MSPGTAGKDGPGVWGQAEGAFRHLRASAAEGRI